MISYGYILPSFNNHQAFGCMLWFDVKCLIKSLMTSNDDVSLFCKLGKGPFINYVSMAEGVGAMKCSQTLTLGRGIYLK